MNTVIRFADSLPVVRFLEMEQTALAAAPEAGVASQLLIWSSAPALVVSHRETRLPAFAAACRQMHGRGIDVARRSSGGSAVPQGPGVVNVTLVYSPPEPLNIAALYGLFCARLAAGFTALGVHTRVGEVAGAYCDGRYNLVARGRKLAGTAMRLKGRLGLPSVVLAHATILVTMPPRLATQRVNEFYELAGELRNFDPAAVTSLARETGREQGLADELAQAMQSAFGDLGGGVQIQ